MAERMSISPTRIGLSSKALSGKALRRYRRATQHHSRFWAPLVLGAVTAVLAGTLSLGIFVTRGTRLVPHPVPVPAPVLIPDPILVPGPARTILVPATVPRLAPKLPPAVPVATAVPTTRQQPVVGPIGAAPTTAPAQTTTTTTVTMCVSDLCVNNLCICTKR